MAELAPPLAMFLREYLPRDRGTSRHTVESYALCFKLLVVFAADKHAIRPCTLEIGHLDIATILEFLEHLERERGNGVRTRNARLAAIKAFFRFLEFRRPGYLDLAAQVREIPAKKGEVPLIGSLDRAETRALPDDNYFCCRRQMELRFRALGIGVWDRVLLCCGMSSVATWVPTGSAWRK